MSGRNQSGDDDQAKIPSPHAEQLDRALLLERVEGDQELLAEMIQLFLADAPHLLDAMRNALLQGDMILLERSAHSMKGAAGNMSAMLRWMPRYAGTKREKRRRWNNQEPIWRPSKAQSNACFRFLQICARRFRNEDPDRR